MLSAGERPPQPSMNGTVKDLNQATLNHRSTAAAMWQTPKSAEQTVKHIWIITGPAGSGKSTVGRGLQQELDLPFLEGDDVRYVDRILSTPPTHKTPQP